MKVAVVGGGGREHAIVRKLSESPLVSKLYAVPGNGGMADLARLVPIRAMDLEAIRDFAIREKIDFVVVAPDDPLAAGLVDMLHAEGIKCFGPEKRAAEIESSKAFAKDLMKKYDIPTAKYAVFTDAEEAAKYIDEMSEPVVVKADGLALGKGVIIAPTRAEAKAAVAEMLGGKFGESGKKLVVEEYLTGPEVSVLAFTDGKTVVPMVSSMDHKRALDGDKGLNTGGMGAVCPNPYYSPEIAREAEEKIFRPTLKAMAAEGRKFKGCLYFGLMVTADGVKVIEYNSRFGDPETQAVLPLLKSDLMEIMLAVEEERLTPDMVSFSDECSCAVVLASKGYPEKYNTGYEIKENGAEGYIYYAGAKAEDGVLKTSGGRVMAVTALGKNLREAVEKAYREAEKVAFTDKYMRTDIGRRALEKTER